MRKTIVWTLLLQLALAAAVFPQKSPQRVYYEKQPDNVYRFYAEKGELEPYSIKLWFTELLNMTCTVAVPYSNVIGPGEGRELLFSLEITDPAAKHRFQYNYNWSSGDTFNARHDDSHVYVFPWEHGKKHLMAQGYNGGVTHFGDGSFALDFMMPEGTLICAARDGIVTVTESKYTEGGMEPKFRDKGNHVTILHKDGSYGYYTHFRHKGILVSPGDRLKTGDPVGYSGNTGYSGAPHLHFEVRVPVFGSGRRTIPVSFLDHGGGTVMPECSTFYYSFHPGGGSFPVELGRSIRHEDYADHAPSVEQTGKVTVRTEKIDNTVLFFIQNGGTVGLEVTLTISEVDNMEASAPLEGKYVVPALTEKFALFLRRKKCEKPSDYNRSWKYGRYTWNTRVIE